MDTREDAPEREVQAVQCRCPAGAAVAPRLISNFSTCAAVKPFAFINANAANASGMIDAIRQRRIRRRGGQL